MGILRILGLRDEGLRPLERAILTAVADRLAAPARHLMLRQLDAVTLVQRHSEDREVNLYPMRRGRVHLDDELRFVLDRPEARLASVEVRLPGQNYPKRAEVWIADRRVFSIAFSEPPRTSEAPEEIVEVKLWVDPMQPAAGVTSLPDLDRLLDWLGAIGDRWEVSNVTGCETGGRGRSNLDRLGYELPHDVPELLNITGGFQVGDWVVHGDGSLRTVVLDHGDYLVLAEGPGGSILASKRDDGGGQVFWMHPDVEQPTVVGDSLKAGLAAVLAEDVDRVAE